MSSPAIASPEVHSPPKKPAHPKESSSPETVTQQQKPQNQTPQASVPPRKQQPSVVATPPPQQQQQSGQRATSSSSTTRPTGSGDGVGSDVVGEYVLGETIGKGTFGKVKIGLHLVTGEKVAIKILEKKRIVQVADAERVAREIKILKRNRHLNVIQLYEVIDSPERIYLIMEHVDSGEMFEYIVAHHRIREQDAVLFFQQTVDGLAYLHANDVTHRDLKPENLLLQSHAAGFLVKIVDFGLSNTHDNGRLLRTACGSPCYAAPEMIEGKLYKGPVADIWSLGVVLFAAVCGYLPFEDSNTNMLYKKILSADYKLPPFLSHSVQDLIRRILETNPEKRLAVELIRQHPWFTSMRAVLPKSLAERDDLVVKEMVFTQLESLGIEKAVVVDALRKKAHNNITASYYLLYSKFVRRLKDSSNASASGGQSQIRNTNNGASAAPQHKRLDRIDESKGKVNSPRPSAPAKKVGGVGAMSIEGTSGGVSTSSGQSAHHGDTGGHRRHTTHPPTISCAPLQSCPHSTASSDTVGSFASNFPPPTAAATCCRDITAHGSVSTAATEFSSKRPQPRDAEYKRRLPAHGDDASNDYSEWQRRRSTSIGADCPESKQ